MAVIARPQLRIHQELSISASATVQRQLACIVGPNAKLHRYDVSAEKALIGLGTYNPDADRNYAWPDRSAGGVVDPDSVRLLADDALLLYHTDLAGDSSGGRGTVAKVNGYSNRIKSSTLGYKTNGASYPHSSLFGDRGVKIGDRVRITGGDDNCEDVNCWTSVIGFAGEAVAASIAAATADGANQGAVTSTLSASKTGGPANCILITAGGTYNGLADGKVQETYTLIVTKGGTAQCTQATLRVVSASGTDDVDAVVVTVGAAFNVGTRGVTATFSLDTGQCVTDAATAGVLANLPATGQTFQVVARQTFHAACVTSGGTYTGAADDVYRIECTKGGLFASGPKPEITVSTVKGLDFSGPTQVTAVASAVAVGSHGITAAFGACGVGSAPLGLRKGDVWYISATAATTGRMSTLILQDDLPADLLAATDLNLYLYLPGRTGLEITRKRMSDPPNVNYVRETTQIVVKAGVTAYDSDWTVGGVVQALPLKAGTLYAEYNEWLPNLVDAPVRVDSVDDLTTIIPGQLDPKNPLSYGVYKALQNSGGQPVYAMAVATPGTQDWVKAYSHLEERNEFYNIVPMTFDKEAINLAITTAATQSAPGVNLFKGVFCGLKRTATKMLVGESTAAAQAISPTSTDGKVVLATVSDNPQASGTQYTLLQVPAANGGFLKYGVKAGDAVRFLFTVDAYGEPSYTTLTVDSVLSENSLLLTTGLTTPVTQAQKVEIWRTLSTAEIKDDLKAQAQAMKNRRVCAVWPDALVSVGRLVDGYFAAAALAGLRSGALPHRPLTNVSITGFDSVPSARLFTSGQIDDLMNGGVWIIGVDRNGALYNVNALTTDMTDLNTRTESIRTNLDNISTRIRDMWSALIGTTNVSPALLRRLRHDLENLLDELSSNALTDEIGSQIIVPAGTSTADMITLLRVHPTARDRVEIRVNPTLPAPWNEGDVYLVL